ncbi:MAG TPA: hypothetical protein VGF21_19565 [Thermoleophilaceae bacterium]|jgi:hypothetical protein
MTLETLSPREASIFACVCDTVVAPGAGLPPVQETDAVEFLDRWLGQAPRLNRAGLRALLYAAELAPRVVGARKRLRALPEPERAEALARLERSRRARDLVKLMSGIAFLAYYGNDAIMSRLGYDADANVARGRRLRAAEARP